MPGNVFRNAYYVEEQAGGVGDIASVTLLGMAENRKCWRMLELRRFLATC